MATSAGLSMRLASASVLAVLLLAQTLAGSVSAAQPSAGHPQISDESPLNDPEEDCLEPVPATAGASGITDSGQTVALEVTVLRDGVSKARADEVMTRAADTYAPLNIDLVVAAYKRIRIKGDPPRPGGKTPSAGARHLFARMKEKMGGSRPKGSDLVHLLTSKDAYYFRAGEPEYGLAGVADCIGGVRYRRRAFSFSEGTGEYQDGPRDLSWIIAAHEIGHLMGAHHHYGNCGQGSPLIQENETPCTVMWPFIIFWNAGNFGTLEGAVVRGHAVDFASP